MNQSERPVQDKNNINGGEPSGFTGTTDRVSGEYRYKSGYTQQIYSDAHYVPAGESTAPPRYYTPPENRAKPPEEEKPRRTDSDSFLRVFCLCLVCLIIGGAAGVLYMGKSMERRFDTVEQRLSRAESGIDEAYSLGENAMTAANSISSMSTVTRAGELTPAVIYDIACRQVVAISTDASYTNFFGQTTSSPVTGSGFIVTSDGYILTNYHVIDYAYQNRKDITVMLRDGTKYPAAIVGVEAPNDLAVLKIDAGDLDAVTFGDSDALSVGDELFAVGNPLGELEFTMTFGRVSALDRLISTEENSLGINMFQFDAAVNNGNSGGPVYNDRGEVVGIVTAKYTKSGVEGLGFAIPVNDAADIAADLITKGYVTGKAYMGVQLDPHFTSVYSRYYGLPNGAYVSYVERGSSAERAGIKPGDIITALGDISVKSYTDMSNAINRFSAGDSALVSVYRAGSDLQLPIVFDEAGPDGSSVPAGKS